MAETKLTHRSVSQLGSFVKCGEQYRLEKVVKAPKQPAAWFAQGIAFHSAAEAWEKGDRSLSPEDVLDLVYYPEYDRIISEEMAKEPDLARWLTGGRVHASNDIPRRRARGAEQVEGYLRYALAAPERPWLYQGDVAVEVPFSLDLDGLEVIGYIDNLLIWPTGHVTVRDWKTGTKRPDWAFQLGVYALAIEQDTGYLPRWGDFWMAKDAAPDAPVDLSPFTRAKVTRWFHNIDKGIRLGLFTPNPGDHCRTCSVPDFCQGIGSKPDEYPPTQPEEEAS